MIKKFESFSKLPSLDEAYNYIELFANNAEEEIEDIYELLGDKFINNNGYMIDLSEVVDINENDEDKIFKLYDMLIRNYGEMPDYSKIEPLFLELMDMKVVEFSILLYRKCFCFLINTVPNIREKKEFDVESWDNITEPMAKTREILPICNGIKDMDYKVNTYLGFYDNNRYLTGKISILVSV